MTELDVWVFACATRDVLANAELSSQKWRRQSKKIGCQVLAHAALIRRNREARDVIVNEIEKLRDAPAPAGAMSEWAHEPKLLWEGVCEALQWRHADTVRQLADDMERFERGEHDHNPFQDTAWWQRVADELERTAQELRISHGQTARSV
jgi:hypothetical protein